jgi:hypothetical protein
MRQKLSQHSDLLFVGVMLIAFLGVGFYAYQQRYVNMDNWNTDFSQRSVSLGDIMQSDVPRDAIRAINTPRYTPVSDIDWLAPTSPVIVLRLEGDDASARAYPLAVMLLHEIVNDTVADVPIAVTYCPLCNSPIIYERTVDDNALMFKVSGNLRRSGFIMYDEESESWWQQFTGEAIVGKHTGAMLQIVPSTVVGFGEFVAHYPDGLVMVGDAEQPDQVYGTTPMIGYDSALPMYYREEVDARLPAMERVLAARINGQAIAYPFSALSQWQVVNDSVADVPVVAFWQPGALSVLDNQTIDHSRDVGMAALFKRTLNGEVLRFQVTDAGMVDVNTGSEWNIFGEAVAGELRGQQLERVDCFPHFWFAWAGTYPDTDVYGMAME